MYSVYTGSNNGGKPVINHDNDQIELAANSKSIHKMPAFIKEAVALVVRGTIISLSLSLFFWQLST